MVIREGCEGCEGCEAGELGVAAKFTKRQARTTFGVVLDVFLILIFDVWRTFPTFPIRAIRPILTNTDFSHCLTPQVYPELGYFRDINFMLRLLMVPSNKHLPRRTKWQSTDAELSWSYVLPRKASSSSGTLFCVSTMVVVSTVILFDNDSFDNGFFDTYSFDTGQ